MDINMLFSLIKSSHKKILNKISQPILQIRVESKVTTWVKYLLKEKVWVKFLLEYFIVGMELSKNFAQVYNVNLR